VYGTAALALAVALLGLGSATRDVHHYAVEIPGGIPAVVHEPGEPRRFPGPPAEERMPVVVLAHGYMGNTPMMSSLGRRLARAGYASVAFGFRGHDRNPRPFSTGGYEFEGLNEDLAAAVRFAKGQPQFDAERIAVAGHSMGAFVAVEWASRDPAVDAVIAIAGGGSPGGPYPPPNVLYIFASGDPQFLREGAREGAASVAGLERLVLDRVYGDFARGSAVRASEVDGVDHLTILYSGEAARRIVEWLEQSLGAGVSPRPGGDGRFGWTALGFAAWLVLFWGLLRALAPFVPRVESPPVASSLRALGVLTAALVAAAVLLSGVDAHGPSGPFGFVGLALGGSLSGYRVLVGLLLLVALTRSGSLRAPGGWRAAGTAAVLIVASYLVLGTLLEPYLWLWPTSVRVWHALAPFALSLPFFLGFELLLRGGRAWLPIVGRVVVVVVIAASAIVQVLPGETMVALGGIVVLFAWFEFVCFRAARVAPNPWLLAIYQAGFIALFDAMLFPIIVP
jgi:pimeloyl-ACP methyl ester carboxylesterase